MEYHYKSVRFIRLVESLPRLHIMDINIRARICSMISHVSTRDDIKKRQKHIIEGYKVCVVLCYDFFSRFGDRLYCEEIEHQEPRGCDFTNIGDIQNQPNLRIAVAKYIMSQWPVHNS